MMEPSLNLWELGIAILPFAVASSVTPGPNNIMVTASALNFGFRRTLPHMLGISIGFPIMLVAVGLGVGQIFVTYPALHGMLVWFGASYLLYLAWKIATAAPPADDMNAVDAPRPITLMQAALFQWVNPKAWVMALGAVTTYTTPHEHLVTQLLVIAATFAAVVFPCISIWAIFGRGLTRALRSPRSLRVFNYTMAALLVASLALFFL